MLDLLTATVLALMVPSLANGAATACTGTISSLDDVSDAVKCTTVNINSFTVPAGETFSLSLEDGTTVNMRRWSPLATGYVTDKVAEGDVTFSEKNWDGPLFQVRLAIPTLKPIQLLKHCILVGTALPVSTTDSAMNLHSWRLPF